MRLVHRHRHSPRGKGLRIAISQEEITADLQYPAADSRQLRRTMAAARRIGHR